MSAVGWVPSSSPTKRFSRASSVRTAKVPVNGPSAEVSLVFQKGLPTVVCEELLPQVDESVSHGHLVGRGNLIGPTSAVVDRSWVQGELLMLA